MVKRQNKFLKARKFMGLIDYADYREVSRNTVYAWRDSGLLIGEDGKPVTGKGNTGRKLLIDVEKTDLNIDALEAFTTRIHNVVDPNGKDLNEIYAGATPGYHEWNREDEVDDETDDEDSEDDDEEEQPPSRSNPPEAGSLSIDDVDRFLDEVTGRIAASRKMTDKEIYVRSRAATEVIKASKERIRLEILRGEVIDRKQVLDKVFRLSRQNRDGWLNWPKQVAVEMASELGVESRKMHDVLLKHVKENLLYVTKIELEDKNDGSSS